ncbi:MAG: hypothetical protein FWH34_07145 [Desulfovibrionaceae bacterium]|nr:hypothetical protein [Desulfovibrionaceae bacterium]
MLDTDRIPIGKLKQAYRLNAQEVDVLIITLARRNCIDLYEIWHEAARFVATEEHNKKSIYDEADEPHFPGVSDLKQDLLQQRIATKRLLRHFLFSARAGTPREHLQKVFDRVLHFTYDEPDEQDIASVNRTLDMIYEQRNLGFHGKGKVDIAWEYVSPELFAKFCSFFDDAVSANKEAAVLHLSDHGYSWEHAVKGLSREIVERILATAATAQVQTIHATPPPEPSSTAIIVPRSLWESKSPKSARDSMMQQDFTDPRIIAYALYNWCGLKNKTEIGKLLGPPDKDPSTYLRLAHRLLAEAATLNIQSA